MAVTLPGWTAATQPLPDVDAMRGQLGQGAGTSADHQRILDAARGHVEAACGPINNRSVTKSAYLPNGHRTLVLPVMRLAQIVHLWDPTGTDVVDSVESRHVQWRDGMLRTPSFVAGEWRAEVCVDRSTEAYSALYEAVLIIAKHLWATRGGLAASGGAFGPGGDAAAGGTGFAIPRRASTLMSPYKVVP